MEPQSIGIMMMAGLGAALGVLGGAVGTYFSIKSASGPRERTFMIQAAAAIWIAIASFLAAMWLTPMPYRPLLWLPYSIVLPVALRAGNRRQERLRREETPAP